MDDSPKHAARCEKLPVGTAFGCAFDTSRRLGGRAVGAERAVKCPAETA